MCVSLLDNTIHVNSSAVITVCGCILKHLGVSEVCTLPSSGSVKKKAYDRNGVDVANVKW